MRMSCLGIYPVDEVYSIPGNGNKFRVILTLVNGRRTPIAIYGNELLLSYAMQDSFGMSIYFTRISLLFCRTEYFAYLHGISYLDCMMDSGPKTDKFLFRVETEQISRHNRQRHSRVVIINDTYL